MPNVPVSPGPSVATRPMGDVRAPLEAFGGGAASRPVDLSGIQETATEIWQAEKKKADQLNVLNAAGKLKLKELITRRYSIDEAPQAFADLESGKNARGVIVF